MNRMETNPEKPNIEKRFHALGTINSIQIPSWYGEAVLKAAVQKVLRIDELMSVYRPDSDISRLNQNAGIRFTEMHEETFQVLQYAAVFSGLSDGAFDITIRPLTYLWGIGKKDNYIPQEEEIKAAVNLVDYKKLLLDEKKRSAKLTDKAQAVDLGGIAKGYAADKVKELLIENGINSALINLGGNIVTIGSRPDGEPWRIGIQHPAAPTGNYLGFLTATDKTIVTSATNERFFIKDGIRYHHILDPQTGYPAQSGLLSITAVCSDSTDADALTTAIFILGAERGIELANRRKAQVIFVTENLDVIASNGLKDIFRITDNHGK